MSQTHLHTVAEEKLEKQNIVQNHFHADVCYHGRKEEEAKKKKKKQRIECEDSVGLGF